MWGWRLPDRVRTLLQVMYSRRTPDEADAGPGDVGLVAVELLEGCERSQHEICRDLHDEGLQLVTAVSLCLDRAVAAFAADDIAGGARALHRAREISDQIGAFLGEVASRSESFSFGSSTLAGALRVRAGRLAGRGVKVEIRGGGERYPASVEAVLLRLSKAVLDFLAGAGATRVEITVGRLGASVAVALATDVGPDDAHPSFVVAALRARLSGGDLVLSDAEGGGRTVLLTIPLEPESGRG